MTAGDAFTLYLCGMLALFLLGALVQLATIRTMGALARIRLRSHDEQQQQDHSA